MEIWSIVRKIRYSYTESFSSKSTECADYNSKIIPINDVKMLMKSIEGQLGSSTDYKINDKIGNELLANSGEMFIFLISCPPKAELDLAKWKLEQTFKMYTPKMILIILNRLTHAKKNGLFYQKEFVSILDKFQKVWDLKYEDIMKLTQKEECENDCDLPISSLEDKNLGLATNHPVHIFDAKKILNPSSFIPFCWFGKLKDFGATSDKFNVSLCQSFQPKLRNDQLCYIIDPNQLLHKDENDLSVYFLIDENKDRQIAVNDSYKVNKTHSNLEDFQITNDEKMETLIYLDTIGRKEFLLTLLI